MITRQVLGRGAWVDLLPGWLSGADALFDDLLSEVPWRAEQRQMYERVVEVPAAALLLRRGRAAAPSGPRLGAGGAERALRRAELGEPFTTAGLCLYRDGRDSVAWHGDTIGRGKAEDTMVAIVSLGSAAHLPAAAPRWRRDHPAPARARRPDRDGRLLPAHLGARDPEDRRPVGPRISVQFRPRGVR